MINFEILAASGEILVWDNQYELHWSSFAPDPRYLTINQNVGGTVSSDKLSGYDDDEVTLSNTVSSDYIFDNYSITGAVLIGKELYDARHRDRHTPELADIGAGVAGVFVSEGVVWLVHKTW